MQQPGSDSVLRAMTDDGAFRVMVARTTDMVRAAVEAQAAEGDVARHLGQLLTGAVLYRETMAPQFRVQGILSGAGRRGQLVADAHPDGTTRGLASPDDDDTIRIGGGTLEMMRSLPSGDLHRGLVEVPAGGGIPEAMMSYLQTSEQVVTMLALACELQAGKVVAAGGYVVQLLPEAPEGPLAVMTERLKDFREIGSLLRRTDSDPDTLLDELLYGMPNTRLDRRPVRFQCRCSETRVITSLATLERAEIEEMIEAGQVLEVRCDYCNEVYRVSPGQLQGLLQRS